MDRLDSLRISSFQKVVYDYYNSHKNTFPWRKTDNPYCILVSEFMLQQTQTHRVCPKYTFFISRFPDIDNLAGAKTKDILMAWQGLGYNRRALYLHRTAQMIKHDYNSQVPQDPDILLQFPGIGPYTAPAVSTFAYNIPNVFIDTNIRSVFIHTFFRNASRIHDKAILPFVEQTLDTSNPRQWYYALMDYGVMIKKTSGNPNVKSKHHQKATPFQGSRRQKRGEIIKHLLSQKTISYQNVLSSLGYPDYELGSILNALETEGFLVQDGDLIKIV